MGSPFFLSFLSSSLLSILSYIPQRNFHNVPQCTIMFQNVPQCATMLQNVPHCFLNINTSIHSKNTQKYLKIHKNSYSICQKYQKIPKKYPKIPQITQKYLKVTENI